MTRQPMQLELTLNGKKSTYDLLEDEGFEETLSNFKEANTKRKENFQEIECKDMNELSEQVTKLIHDLESLEQNRILYSRHPNLIFIYDAHERTVMSIQNER